MHNKRIDDLISKIEQYLSKNPANIEIINTELATIVNKFDPAIKLSISPPLPLYPPNYDGEETLKKIRSILSNHERVSDLRFRADHFSKRFHIPLPASTRQNKNALLYWFESHWDIIAPHLSTDIPFVLKPYKISFKPKPKLGRPKDSPVPATTLVMQPSFHGYPFPPYPPPSIYPPVIIPTIVPNQRLNIPQFPSGTNINLQNNNNNNNFNLHHQISPPNSNFINQDNLHNAFKNNINMSFHDNFNLNNTQNIHNNNLNNTLSNSLNNNMNGNFSNNFNNTDINIDRTFNMNDHHMDQKDEPQRELNPDYQGKSFLKNLTVMNGNDPTFNNISIKKRLQLSQVMALDMPVNPENTSNSELTNSTTSSDNKDKKIC